MECTNCSVSGKKIIYMEDKGINPKDLAHEWECPQCGREEISGFGVIG